MKNIRWKTLLPILLVGGIAIAYRVVWFDDLIDLLWIALFAYATLRGVWVSVSTQARGEAEKEEERSRTLYGELFGKAAYIVGDVPVILALLAGARAACGQVTTALRIELVVVLAVILGYSIWFYRRVSKETQRRKERGEWDGMTLCTEDRQAWKRSDRVHNVCYGIVGVFLLVYVVFGDPMVHSNNAKLKKAITGITADSVTLEEVVPFPWTTVYTFDPYTSRERMEKVIGEKSPLLRETVNEGMTQFVFMNRGRMAACVCAYPDSLGYSLAFTGGENTSYAYPDGGYSHLEQGDHILFEVTREDGVVRLYGVVGE